MEQCLESWRSEQRQKLNAVFVGQPLMAKLHREDDVNSPCPDHGNICTYNLYVPVEHMITLVIITHEVHHAGSSASSKYSSSYVSVHKTVASDFAKLHFITCREKHFGF